MRDSSAKAGGCGDKYKCKETKWIDIDVDARWHISLRERLQSPGAPSVSGSASAIHAENDGMLNTDDRRQRSPFFGLHHEPYFAVLLLLQARCDGRTHVSRVLGTDVPVERAFDGLIRTARQAVIAWLGGELSIMITPTGFKPVSKPVSASLKRRHGLVRINQLR
jgi:hypothetical protein